MIYTITLNPALDYTMDIPSLCHGEVCRSSRESLSCGGKGINVSVLLTRLGVPNIALGIAAGKTGTLLCEYMRELGVKQRFMPVTSGETRINVKLRHETVTEINGAGPFLSASDVDAFISELDFSDGDYVLVAGSEPDSETGDICDRILRAAYGKAETILDTAGKTLKRLLVHKPFLIKPNETETAEIFGIRPLTHNDAVKSALKFQSLGARNVIVSLGERGAVLLTETGRVYKQQAPAGSVINTVGAGDSMLAGFLAEYTGSGDYKKALSFGTAAGSATAFSAGMAEYRDVLTLYESMVH